MRYLPLALLVLVAACGPPVADKGGPTVDAFVGRLTTATGSPVQFGSGEKVTLQMTSDKGASFGVPIQPDGTFKIGWMPIGNYVALLKIDRAAAKSGPLMYQLPGSFAINAGQTDYTIKLGKNWKRS